MVLAGGGGGGGGPAAFTLSEIIKHTIASSDAKTISYSWVFFN